MAAVQNIVSIGSTTTTPLGAAGVFVGVAEEVLSFQEASILVAGAPDAAPGTVFVEFSPDGTNWDESVAYETTGPNDAPVILFPTIAKFFRVRYVNGATILTAFRLTTLFHRNVAGAGIKLDEVNANLEGIKAKTDNLDATLSSRATAANQGTGLLILASIDDKIDNVLERDITDRAGRILGHVVVDSTPGATEATLNSIEDATGTPAGAIPARLMQVDPSPIGPAGRLTIRYDVGVTVIYKGWAPNGTTAAAAAWTISRTTLVAGSPTVTEWTTHGTAVWNNRATSETYS